MGCFAAASIASVEPNLMKASWRVSKPICGRTAEAVLRILCCDCAGPGYGASDWLRGWSRQSGASNGARSSRGTRSSLRSWPALAASGLGSSAHDLVIQILWVFGLCKKHPALGDQRGGLQQCSPGPRPVAGAAQGAKLQAQGQHEQAQDKSPAHIA